MLSRSGRGAGMALILSVAACSPTLPEGGAPPLEPQVETPASPAGDPTRFISFNIPNLHYVEDDWRFESRAPYRLPTEFEIRDALTSVQQMGGQVVRIYTLSVRKPGEPESVPRHVLGPGEFNEAAFVALDRVLSIAGELGIRVIIPFVDNWQHWGGVTEYAAFRGLPSPEFWTNEQLIADFERTIEFVVTRRNTLTGQPYRDDETIFAWETGNELVNPYSWTARIARYIKRLDPQHPVIDGIHQNHLRPESLTDPNIDIVSTHHYTPPDVMVSEIARNIRVAEGVKPYFVGEFGFIPTRDIERVLDTVIQGGAMGALLWSLRFHNRDGGFYWHYEKRGFEAYHWPGFESGEPIDERAVVQLMRRKAFEIQGQDVPPVEAPGPPHLLPIDSPAAISWRGSTGTESYRIERATDEGGPWTAVADAVSDARHPYRPLFADESVQPGDAYFYRVLAENGSGRSGPSNVVGPVTSDRLFLIDELADLSRTSSHTGQLELVTDRPQLVKMDRDRVTGEAGAGLVYRLAGDIEAVRVFTFLPDPETPPAFFALTDDQPSPLPMRATDFFGGPGQPEGPHPVRFEASELPPGSRSLEIRVARGTQIGRVEIYYSRPP